jgi:hypothetical protein
MVICVYLNSPVDSTTYQNLFLCNLISLTLSLVPKKININAITPLPWHCASSNALLHSLVMVNVALHRVATVTLALQ